MAHKLFAQMTYGVVFVLLLFLHIGTVPVWQQQPETNKNEISITSK